MARKRDYAAEYARRVRGTRPGSAERQRARGHELPAGVPSEYQRRVAGTAPGSEARRRAAGQSGAAALAREIRSGRAAQVFVNKGPRNAKGQLLELEVLVTRQNGSQRSFWLRGSEMSDPAKINAIRAAIDARGGPDIVAVFGSPLTIVQRMRGDDEDDVDLEAEDLEAA